MTYNPNGWVVIKITNKEGKTHYRVFGCWYGGYLHGDSWRLNSGITGASREENTYSFYGSSGSEYKCHKNNYRLSGYGSGVLDTIIKNFKEKYGDVKIMPEDTNWLTLNYGEKK